MDVSAHERIHLVASRGDTRDVLPRQGRQDKSVGHANAELVATATSAGVALEARVYALGLIPAVCLRSYPSSRHADVDKTAIVMPDRVDPSTECGNCQLGQLANQ